MKLIKISGSKYIEGLSDRKKFDTVSDTKPENHTEKNDHTDRQKNPIIKEVTNDNTFYHKNKRPNIVKYKLENRQESQESEGSQKATFVFQYFPLSSGVSIVATAYPIDPTTSTENNLIPQQPTYAPNNRIVAISPVVKENLDILDSIGSSAFLSGIDNNLFTRPIMTDQQAPSSTSISTSQSKVFIQTNTTPYQPTKTSLSEDPRRKEELTKSSESTNSSFTTRDKLFTSFIVILALLVIGLLIFIFRIRNKNKRLKEASSSRHFRDKLGVSTSPAPNFMQVKDNDVASERFNSMHMESRNVLPDISSNRNAEYGSNLKNNSNQTRSSNNNNTNNSWKYKDHEAIGINFDINPFYVNRASKGLSLLSTNSNQGEFEHNNGYNASSKNKYKPRRKPRASDHILREIEDFKSLKLPIDSMAKSKSKKTFLDEYFEEYEKTKSKYLNGSIDTSTQKKQPKYNRYSSPQSQSSKIPINNKRYFMKTPRSSADYNSRHLLDLNFSVTSKGSLVFDQETRAQASDINMGKKFRQMERVGKNSSSYFSDSECFKQSSDRIYMVDDFERDAKIKTISNYLQDNHLLQSRKPRTSKYLLNNTNDSKVSNSRKRDRKNKKGYCKEDSGYRTLDPAARSSWVKSIKGYVSESYGICDSPLWETKSKRRQCRQAISERSHVYSRISSEGEYSDSNYYLKDKKFTNQHFINTEIPKKYTTAINGENNYSLGSINYVDPNSPNRYSKNKTKNKIDNYGTEFEKSIVIYSSDQEKSRENGINIQTPRNNHEKGIFIPQKVERTYNTEILYQDGFKNSVLSITTQNLEVNNALVSSELQLNGEKELVIVPLEQVSGLDIGQDNYYDSRDTTKKSLTSAEALGVFDSLDSLDQKYDFIVRHKPDLGPLIVVEPYNPQLSDELDLNKGDEVYVIGEFSDGWILAINNSDNGKVGMIPRKCVFLSNTPLSSLNSSISDNI
ncbi:hypothetical protein BB560_000235 [Smittium megazygosporum]|uniref:SH3 domain-containing protein n=1 Tax=Smittium megazygosporum TaxID=133381 RepID=A0A2T9ZKY1_9FUNG|nr:hypothetical protein BB560_000235 [Smittium megazygosporum]